MNIKERKDRANMEFHPFWHETMKQGTATTSLSTEATTNELTIETNIIELPFLFIYPND